MLQTGMEKQILTLRTSHTAEELRDRLRHWEPWSIRVDFSNGVSTKDFGRLTPFNEHPLSKFSLVEATIPFAEISGGRMLDIGCNAGYNSIHAALKYGTRCTGIDVVPGYIETARFFSELAGVDAQFYIASAETFSRPEEFDVVLHFGTLYHLPNPVLSLRASFDNLRPSGYLALETQVYDHPEDPNICYFMHMQNNDATNFWALSSSVLTKCLELVGFRDIRELLKVVPKEGLAQYMARTILVARKPERPSPRPYPLQHINERLVAGNHEVHH
jgi:2-polyprenyl-3-methyl-5-hydroxy-6-metoxy-1,4-benzoquinol methylase